MAAGQLQGQRESLRLHQNAGHTVPPRIPALMPRLRHPILCGQDETFRNEASRCAPHDLIVIRSSSSIGPSGHQTMNSPREGQRGCLARIPAATLTVIKSCPLSLIIMSLRAPYHYG